MDVDLVCNVCDWGVARFYAHQFGTEEIKQKNGRGGLGFGLEINVFHRQAARPLISIKLK